MDDAKIDMIAREVLASLKKAHAHDAPSNSCAPGKPERVAVPLHPSFHLLAVTGGVAGSPCMLEPDKACAGSLKCRTFGH